jgi:hypothetical protein
MVMKRFLLVVVAIIGAGGAVACNKPTADDCRLAVAKVRELYDPEAATRNADIEAEVRACKGGSTREAVACAIKAHSVDELKACGFMSSKTAK